MTEQRELHLCQNPGDVDEAVAYIVQELYLTRLLQLSRQHNPVQARDYLRLLRQHRYTISRQLRTLPPAAVAFIYNYPLEGFSEQDFRARLSKLLD